MCRFLKISLVGFLTLLFAFFSSGDLRAQTFEIENGDTINRTDASNLKQGYWKVYNKIKKLPGYEDDQLVEEGSYVDNKKEGVWKTYYNNGKLKSEITYKNNIANGFARFYYKNGNVSEEGNWVNNKWDGKYKYYYENGQISYDWNFVNGKREGVQKYYHENGQINYEGEWAGGMESGMLKEWNENGQLVAEKFFNKGKIDTTVSKYYKVDPVVKKSDTQEVTTEQKPIEVEPPKQPVEVGLFTGNGFHKLYNARKQVTKEGNFSNGYLIDGKEYIYGDDARLLRTNIYKNGKVVEVKEE